MISAFPELLKKLKKDIRDLRTTFRRTNQNVVTYSQTVNVTFTMFRSGWQIRSTKNAVILVKGEPKASLCQMMLGVDNLQERVLIQNRIVDNTADVVSRFVFWIEYGNGDDAQAIDRGETVTVTYPVEIITTADVSDIEVQYIDPFSM